MTNKEMLQEIMNTMGTINQRLDKIEARVDTLENGKKPTTSNGKGKKTATKKEEPKTWTEKKAEYAKQFTEEQRKAYGEQKQAERTKQKTAYEKTNEFFKDKGYVGKATWRKKYNEILASIA